MTKIEKRLFDFVSNHIVVIAFITITILGMMIRIIPRDFVSGDARGYLLPWYEQILENGVSRQVGDYNFAYQLVILLLTKLPLKPLYAYKMFRVSLISCWQAFLRFWYTISVKKHIYLYIHTVQFFFLRWS